MQPYPYAAEALTSLVNSLSEPRFRTFLDRANGQHELGMRQYVWNAALASAFHSPLHVLEVVLRNAIHDRMTRVHGSGWLRHPNILKSPETRMVDDAYTYLADRGESTTPDKVVAELSFRFWVGILSRKYDRLWTSTLQAAFSPRPARHELHQQLDRLRTLRNRIAHHEPILHRHLMADLADIKEIVGALSPVARDWLDWHEQVTSRFGTSVADIDVF